VIDNKFLHYHGVTAPSEPEPPHYRGFKVTLRRITLLGLLWMSDQPDAQISSWQYTEPTIPANERPQTHALYSAATGNSFIPKQWHQILVPM